MLFVHGRDRSLGDGAVSRPTKGNLRKRTMHLTNYAVNAEAEGFDNSGDAGSGSKRLISACKEQFEEELGINYDKMWDAIGSVISKTLIAVQPQLHAVYHRYFGGFVEANVGSKRSCCFEILGFDVMFDARGRCWLIETNASPSFRCDSALDEDIKYNLLHEAFRIVGRTLDASAKFHNNNNNNQSTGNSSRQDVDRSRRPSQDNYLSTGKLAHTIQIEFLMLQIEPRAH